MERYFLGNNSGNGFWNEYDGELKRADKVALIKGGSGTGKSTMMKKIAAFAQKQGHDIEIWHCSGDPKSLDGVYIKDINRAVVDATAPHASGADIPVVKDRIFDVANNLDKSKLDGMRDEIEKLIKCKKTHFMRVYQHLKSALCHYNNQIEIEKQGVDEKKIRRIASEYCEKLFLTGGGESRVRTLFSRAISPSGENEFFDHLKDKCVYKVKGGAYAVRVFFDEIYGLAKGTFFRVPLSPEAFEGAVCGDVAIVDFERAGGADGEIIDLERYESFNRYDVLDEKNNAVIQTALAVERLNRARESHMGLEDIFVKAMNFDGNEKTLEDIKAFLFE